MLTPTLRDICRQEFGSNWHAEFVHLENMIEVHGLTVIVNDDTGRVTFYPGTEDTHRVESGHVRYYRKGVKPVY